MNEQLLTLLGEINLHPLADASLMCQVIIQDDMYVNDLKVEYKVFVL